MEGCATEGWGRCVATSSVSAAARRRRHHRGPLAASRNTPCFCASGKNHRPSADPASTTTNELFTMFFSRRLLTQVIATEANKRAKDGPANALAMNRVNVSAHLPLTKRTSMQASRVRGPHAEQTNHAKQSCLQQQQCCCSVDTTRWQELRRFQPNPIQYTPTQGPMANEQRAMTNEGPMTTTSQRRPNNKQR